MVMKTIAAAINFQILKCATIVNKVSFLKKMLLLSFYES